jgi:mono/diheme cytochrome c family protein
VLLLAVGLLVLAGVGWFCSDRPTATQTPAGPTAREQPSDGKELYANYCAACHGEKGDGQGLAARFLYPRPRDFGSAKFRLASTINHMPTDQDLMHVLTRGMPGSAMFPFGHLSDADRQALIVYLRQLTHAAVVARVRATAAPDADLTSVDQDVEELLRPGDVIVVPADLPASSAESIARGRDIFGAKGAGGCASCHGQTGTGEGVQDQRDDSGMAIRPRDFTRGIFKGGREPEELYARIVYGMAGTPMPSNTLLKPAEVGDVINFILSLSRSSAQAGAQHHRTRLIAKRLAASLPDDIPEDAWHDASPAAIVVSPLWWRVYEEPDLQVQALHDDRSLALRLTWRDATRNDQAVRPQDFEDMAAVQLFKGEREPFLGMGAAGKTVDLWMWRAGWQGKPAAYADVDTAYPHMAVDLYPFEKPGSGARRHAPENQPEPFLTARAAGNLRSDPSQAFTGNSLEARGLGSVTMLPRVSQLVSATGHWQDGHWTVTLRRPLSVKAEDGLPLSPGDRLSIAFAIWDGAARDRNGQKLVSIWHDLELE